MMMGAGREKWARPLRMVAWVAAILLLLLYLITIQLGRKADRAAAEKAALERPTKWVVYFRKCPNDTSLPRIERRAIDLFEENNEERRIILQVQESYGKERVEAEWLLTDSRTNLSSTNLPVGTITRYKLVARTPRNPNGTELAKFRWIDWRQEAKWVYTGKAGGMVMTNTGGKIFTNWADTCVCPEGSALDIKLSAESRL